jgi:hypothetical protein
VALTYFIEQWLTDLLEEFTETLVLNVLQKEVEVVVIRERTLQMNNVRMSGYHEDVSLPMNTLYLVVLDDVDLVEALEGILF